MNKTINLEKLTGGKMIGDLTIYAFGWETRYSWGHTAEIAVDCELVAKAKITYCNRTWESYRFESVIHQALFNYVKALTGIDPIKSLCNRDRNPMKDKAAETRRLARVSSHEFAASLYKALTAKADGKEVVPEVVGRLYRKVA